MFHSEWVNESVGVVCFDSEWVNESVEVRLWSGRLNDSVGKVCSEWVNESEKKFVSTVRG